VSPLLVRRYRAERLLRDEFEALRAKVLARVARRLRACGARLDAGDLEACYSQAWQGLYAAVLEGQQIDDAAAWLTLVSYRRAIDEHRSRGPLACERFGAAGEDVVRTGAEATRRERAGSEHDIAARLDDHVRLRQLFEALRGRLSAREQQAATLCYLQGLSRAQAAARMGVSESRMRKLMDGGGSRSPGVAAKMGALVQTIGAGGWCEEQGSLMRGLAYGILDPDGERYRLALLHRDACPACRAYVLSLRGLAAVLPPVPLLWLGSGALAGAGTGVAVTGGATGSSGASGAGAGSLGGLGAGTLSASGAAGVGAAGSSWWLAGPLGAKLAVGCLVALGVGAGCVALDGRAGHTAGHAHRSHARRAALARAVDASSATAAPLGSRPAASADVPAGAAGAGAATPRATAATRASREFGPEQAAGSAGSTKPRPSTVRAASATTAARSPQQAPDEGEPRGRPSAGTTSSGAVPAAQREFAPG
jgi:RNA polymerase sigma factor (sigma-70 family)